MLEGAQPANPRPEPHRLERVRRGARAEPGLSVRVAAGSRVCVSLRRGVCVLHKAPRCSKAAASRSQESERGAPRLLSAHPVRLGPLCPAERGAASAAQPGPGAEGGDRPPPPRRTSQAGGGVQANERPGAGLSPGQRWGAG